MPTRTLRYSTLEVPKSALASFRKEIEEIEEIEETEEIEEGDRGDGGRG